eukprot:684717-Prymnesium_polylepis.2
MTSTVCPRAESTRATPSKTTARGSCAPADIAPVWLIRPRTIRRGRTGEAVGASSACCGPVAAATAASGDSMTEDFQNSTTHRATRSSDCLFGVKIRARHCLFG